MYVFYVEKVNYVPNMVNMVGIVTYNLMKTLCTRNDLNRYSFLEDGQHMIKCAMLCLVMHGLI